MRTRTSFALRVLTILPIISIGSAHLVYAQPVAVKQKVDGSVRKAKWQKFWGEFVSAMKADDRTKLFALTSKSGFSWEEEPLDLPKDKPGSITYSIPSQEAFNRVYPKVFAPKVRKRILGAKVIDTETGGYFIEWEERRGSYSVFFEQTPTGDFQFAGLNIGPP